MLQTIANSEVRLSSLATTLNNLNTYISSLKAAGSSYADIAYSHYLILQKDYNYLANIQAVLKGMGLATDTIETTNQDTNTQYLYTAAARDSSFLAGIANGWNSYLDYISVMPKDLTIAAGNVTAATAPTMSTETKTNIGLGLSLAGLLFLLFGKRKKKK